MNKTGIGFMKSNRTPSNMSSQQESTPRMKVSSKYEESQNSFNQDKQRINLKFLNKTPTMKDSSYRIKFGSYIDEAKKEKKMMIQSIQHKQKLNNVISACYYLEHELNINNTVSSAQNDSESQQKKITFVKGDTKIRSKSNFSSVRNKLQPIVTKDFVDNDKGKQSQRDTSLMMRKKLDMNLYLENMRQQEIQKTCSILKEYENTDEAENIKMLYFYKIQSNEDYKDLSKDIINDYKIGIADPSREVGRIEKSRQGVKNFIKNLIIKSKRR